GARAILDVCLLPAPVFSHDGKLVAGVAADDPKLVRVWDANTGRLHTSIAAQEPVANAVTATAETATAALTGSSPQVPTSLAFSNDSRLLALVTAAGGIEVWDLADHQKWLELHGNSRILPPIVFSPDGNTVAARCDDRTVRLWDSVL